MSQQTTNPKLGEAFSAALNFAADKHRTRVRKGGDIPWCYRSLLEKFRARRANCRLVDELGRVIQAWKAELNKPKEA